MRLAARLWRARRAQFPSLSCLWDHLWFYTSKLTSHHTLRQCTVAYVDHIYWILFKPFHKRGMSTAMYVCSTCFTQCTFWHTEKAMGKQWALSESSDDGTSQEIIIHDTGKFHSHVVPVTCQSICTSMRMGTWRLFSAQSKLCLPLAQRDLWILR